MTIEERYTRATHSSSLQVSELSGVADPLIAAGWMKDGLGPTLWRLRAEYDLVARDVVRARPDDLMGMVLILTQLKTLGEGRAALGGFMIAEATRAKFMQSDDVVLGLAGRVLESFIHPQCFTCGGRGTLGDSGATLICKKCAGTGRRVETIGKTDDEREFSARVLAELDRKMEIVARAMRHRLRNRLQDGKDRGNVSPVRRHIGPQALAPQFNQPAVPVDSGPDPDMD